MCYLNTITGKQSLKASQYVHLVWLIYTVVFDETQLSRVFNYRINFERKASNDKCKQYNLIEFLYWKTYNI